MNMERTEKCQNDIQTHLEKILYQKSSHHMTHCLHESPSKDVKSYIISP